MKRPVQALKKPERSQDVWGPPGVYMDLIRYPQYKNFFFSRLSQDCISLLETGKTYLLKVDTL